MYNHSTIVDCLAGLIGFEPGYSADIATLDEDLTTSESGVYLDSTAHPLLTYENLLAVAEHFERTNVRAHSTTATYKKGDVVKTGTTLYRSLQAANTNNAVSDTDWWEPTNLLSNYLRKLYNGASSKLISRLFVEKKWNEAAKTLLGAVNLYEGVGNISGRITKTGRLVGLKITLLNEDTHALLTHIGLQVDEVQNPLNIYLYHSSSNVPVKTFTLNHTRAVQFQWHSITTEILSFLSESVNAGGAYYICYYEDELTGSAIKKDISFTGKTTCNTCTGAAANKSLYQKWSKFVSIQPFYLNSDDIDLAGKSLWDEEKELYVDDNTFGINLQLQVMCDVSRIICAGKSVITEALRRQVVVDFLNEAKFSLRDNQMKVKLSGLAAAALDNEENGEPGEHRKLEQAIKALSFDFSNISSFCLPCAGKNKNTRMGSVWG
jgi:hypothetical protein